MNKYLHNAQIITFSFNLFIEINSFANKCNFTKKNWSNLNVPHTKQQCCFSRKFDFFFEIIIEMAYIFANIKLIFLGKIDNLIVERWHK